MNDLAQMGSLVGAMAGLASVGALDELCEGPASAAELAERLTLDEPALRRSLEVARALGFLRAELGVYAVVSDDSVSLPLQVLMMMRMLPDHLRTGASIVRNKETRGVVYAEAVSRLGRRFQEYAVLLADALRETRCETILDVGAGSGVWSLAMAERHAGCVVTALDLAPVLACFQEHAGPRHEVIAGDYLTVDLPRTWDRVVLANVLHLEREARAHTLFARAASWAGPDGRVVVVDQLFRDEESDLAVAAYELHLALRVDGGRVYTAEEVEGWGRDLGLEVEARHAVAPARGAGALVFRRRPA